MIRSARPYLVALVAFAASAAHAQSLPENARVRVVANGLGNGQWLEGKLVLNKGSGCTMVQFDRPQAGGYTMAALNSIARMERNDKGTWTDVPVKPLLAREPKSCRDAAND